VTVADIENRNSIPTFTIRKSKTDAGERTVPIHSELVRLGFLDYVEDRRKAGDSALWKLNDQPSRDGSTFYSDWHRLYRKAQGFTEKLLDFHSFRHTAVSVIRGVVPALPETAIDQTVGHESVGSERARRYAQHPVESLQRVVESLRYPGLDLPRVYPTRSAT
jgi:integrase